MTPQAESSIAGPGPRILATLLDALTFLLAPALLLPVGVLFVHRGVNLTQPALNVVGFLFVVLPATLWTAWCEARSRQATPGKRLLGLVVVTAMSGARIGRGRSLLRNLIKIALPWQLGHTAVIGLAAVGETSPPPWLLAVTVLAYALPLLSLTLVLVRPHRAMHDRLAGTRVRRDVAAAAPQPQPA
jgi:uncharacterized RDD family membrane protein YckC